jgi:Transcriptional regulator, AbiEi antitoxin
VGRQPLATLRAPSAPLSPPSSLACTGSLKLFPLSGKKYRDPSTGELVAATDRAVSRFAATQHGVVSTSQLHRAGLTKSGIDRRVADGRLHWIYRGVYAVGRTNLRREARWLAAVLAYGPDAVLSHRSAAALWSIRNTSRTAVDISVPSPSTRSRPGIDAHATANLHPDDVTTIDGIPVTSLARTPAGPRGRHPSHRAPTRLRAGR